MIVAVAPASTVGRRTRRTRAFTLLIEVADSTLEFDLADKGRTYAEASIIEYWVLDLAGERLRIFRRPVGGEFTETRLAAGDETVEPLAISDFSISVHELLSS